jgi:hypothetical protein
MLVRGVWLLLWSTKGTSDIATFWPMSPRISAGLEYTEAGFPFSAYWAYKRSCARKSHVGGALMAHFACETRLQREHSTALFFTLSKHTRQIIAILIKMRLATIKGSILSDLRLLNVVFTNECSRGENSFSTGRTEDAEVRRPMGVILPTSLRLGEADMGDSGISSWERYPDL